MRICLIGNYFPPWRGGMETYVYNLAKALSARGHTVKVVCASDPYPPGIYRIGGVEVQRLWKPIRFYGTPITPGLFRRLMADEADVFHASFPSPYNAFLASQASGLKGSPLSSHGIMTWSPSPRQRRIIAIHDKYVMPFYLLNFARIIATSPTYADTSPILTRYRDRVVVVPNGVDCKSLHPGVDGSPIRVRHALGDKCYHGLWESAFPIYG